MVFLSLFEQNLKAVPKENEKRVNQSSKVSRTINAGQHSFKRLWRSVMLYKSHLSTEPSSNSSIDQGFDPSYGSIYKPYWHLHLPNAVNLFFGKRVWKNITLAEIVVTVPNFMEDLYICAHVDTLLFIIMQYLWCPCTHLYILKIHY